MLVLRRPSAHLPLLLAALLPLPAIAAAAGVDLSPQPFSAQYRVLRNGDAIGRAVLTLSRKGTDFVFSNVTRGTAGLAALLGLDVDESTQFRWQDGSWHDLKYDYRMRTAFRSITRSTLFDWRDGKIRLIAGAMDTHYAAFPGTVDRNLTVLVLAKQVADGRRGDTVIPVAMSDHVSRQHYRIAEHPVTLEVPAGRFVTYAVQRSDADNGLRAWFAPPMLAPVRMEQRDGKGSVYLLELMQAPR